MKSWIQTVLLLALLMAVVGGVTFLVHYSMSPESPGGTEPDNGKKQPPRLLTFPIKVREWQPGEGGELEAHTPGHRNFWFENRNPVPVLVGLQAKTGCACAEIDLCALTRQETNQLFGWWAAQLLTAPTKPALVEQLIPYGMLTDAPEWFMRPEPRWRHLDRGGPNSPTLRVDPHCVGLARIRWKGEREQPIRIAAKLWNQGDESGTSPRGEQSLEMAISFVAPVRVFPLEPEFKEVLPGRPAEWEFVCWSSTRPHFTLEPAGDKTQTNVVVTVRPLTEADRAKWAGLKTQMLSGWTVKVTIHDRLSDSAQFDLGPFRHKVELAAGPNLHDPVSVTVRGLVRGEVMLGGLDDRDRDQFVLALGNFRARDGVKKEFTLYTDQPGVELALDDITVLPAELYYLRKTVQLVRDTEGSVGGRTQWKLTVEVPRDRVEGTLPQGSALLLKIQGKASRRLRLPLTGTAFN